MIPTEKIQSLKAEHTELKKEIYDTAKMSDRRYYSKISKRYKELENILGSYDRVIELEKTISENKELINNEKDEELIALAQEEIEDAQKELEENI
ncbi:MAG: PCRF domain-containing protein, partial [Candidatus Cloacimonetes bacterium]|nr:PCRF domain-containing protein [Candidatus Cloacimonadota bacterium]